MGIKINCCRSLLNDIQNVINTISCEQPVIYRFDEMGLEIGLVLIVDINELCQDKVSRWATTQKRHVE